MPTIHLDATGPTKASLVERMYEYCALSGAEFERSAEEMTAGLRDLNDTVGELPFDVGYDFPTYADGLLEEPSGLSRADARAITLLAAQTRMASIGGALSPDLKASLNRAVFGLYSRYATVPDVSPVRGASGAGYKGRFPIITTGG